MPRSTRDRYKEELDRARGNLSSAFEHLIRVFSDFEGRAMDENGPDWFSTDPEQTTGSAKALQVAKGIKTSLDLLTIIDDTVKSVRKNI